VYGYPFEVRARCIGCEVAGADAQDARFTRGVVEISVRSLATSNPRQRRISDIDRIAAALATQVAATIPPIGVAAASRDGDICAALKAPPLAPGTALTLIQPAGQQSVLVVTIVRRAPACEPLERAGVPGPYYLVHASSAESEAGTVWVAVSGRLRPRRAGSGGIEVPLSAEYPNARVRSCTSQEGLHLTVWAGIPLTSERLWHHYYYLGYDVDPSCHDRDVRDPPR